MTRQNRPDGPATASTPATPTTPPARIQARSASARDGIIPERDWQRTVVECFRLNGWRVFVDRVAYRSDPGWPDLVCVHPRHGVVFCELKRETGQLSPVQESWRDALIAAGQHWFVLRPSDWLAVVAITCGQLGAPHHPRSER